MPAQPSDEWTYLRPEEFADDDAVERIGARLDVGAEDAALHLVDADDAARPQEGLDPGRTLVPPPDGEGPAATYFDDEEPDVPGASTGDDELTAEPGVDELLVSQHYTFDPEPT